MKCPICNTENVNGSLFCCECGGKLEPEFAGVPFSNEVRHQNVSPVDAGAQQEKTMNVQNPTAMGDFPSQNSDVNDIQATNTAHNSSYSFSNENMGQKAPNGSYSFQNGYAPSYTPNNSYGFQTGNTGAFNQNYAGTYQTANTNSTAPCSTHKPVDYTREARNGYAISSFVISLINLILFAGFGFPFSVAGIVFGIIGVKSNRKGLSIAGIVLNALSILVVVLLIVFYVALIVQLAPGIAQGFSDAFDMYDMYDPYYGSLCINFLRSIF